MRTAMNTSAKFAFFLVSYIAVAALSGCQTAAKVEILPNDIVLEGVGATLKLKARVLDTKGEEMTDKVKIVWFSSDTKHIKLSHDGEIKAISSGEAKVEVEVVGTDLKTVAPVRIKIAASINTSHEKLRLWTGQVKENVWAEVHSEKGAFIEGYLPVWTSDDPSIVKVEPIEDPKRRQSWVKMTAMKSGDTIINATYSQFTKSIRVAVFDEDEQVALDGTRIPRDTDTNSDDAPQKEANTKN